MSNDYLIVVDAQNDFVTGSLGSEQAQEAMVHAVECVKEHNGPVIFTMDTHHQDYLDTQEGQILPVVHCIEGEDGWRLIPQMEALQEELDAPIFEKLTFASVQLAEYLKQKNAEEPIDSIQLIGLCTDICVVSNALTIKGFLPDVPISVSEQCCAGVTPESHDAALQTMRSCQIQIVD